MKNDHIWQVNSAKLNIRSISYWLDFLILHCSKLASAFVEAYLYFLDLPWQKNAQAIILLGIFKKKFLKNKNLFFEEKNIFHLRKPRVVDLSFIVTRAHKKIKALFCCINFITRYFVKKIFSVELFSFSIYIKKKNTH